MASDQATESLTLENSVKFFFCKKREKLMAGAFLGLEIGKKGVLTHQKALNVVGQNISNAETEGYSRQEVSLKATDPLDGYATAGGAGQIGTGVTLAEINRVRDAFIDAQLRDQMSFQGSIEILSKNLTSLQTIYNEPSDENLSAAIDLFFQGLEEVNNDPENKSVRVTMVERAKSLSSLVGLTYNRMSDNLNSVNEEIALKVDKVNSLAKSISELNMEISKVKNTGQSPNDTMDQRDVLLDELSELVNVNIREDSQGTVYVRVGEHLLVQGGTINELHTVTDPDYPGLVRVSTEPYNIESSMNTDVATASIGGDAGNQNFSLTVFQTATKHKMQSRALIDVKNTLTEKSTLEQAGITSGSMVLNGVQIFFENSDTFSDLAQKINDAGLGVNAFFERGKLQMASVKTGTANQISLARGTSNFTEVMQFNSDRELNSMGEIVFEGEVKDAKYAYDGTTYYSSLNSVHNIVPGVDVELKGVGSTTITSNNVITGGKMAGLLEYQDGYLKEEMMKLDQFAYAFTKEFNKLHYEGYGLDGQSQRLFFNNYDSPFDGSLEQGAALAFSVNEQIVGNVSAFAAAKGVYENEGDKIPVSSGTGDGSNALTLSALKYAKIVNNSEYNMRTRLSVLNGGSGIDVGRPQSRFTVSNGTETAVVTLEDFDDDSTFYDLQETINDALKKNGMDTQVTITPLADGSIRLLSSNQSLTFAEGPGSTATDLHITAASGASGSGTMVVETAQLNAKFRGEPLTLTGYISNTVSQVGVKAEEMNRLKKNTAAITTQLENERLSVSGVSIDEELTKMIQFQQAFTASARIISMVDELLTTIVNLGR
jgi:flagellar hook-associated protein FlgK